MLTRLRRNRKSAQIRSLVAENSLRPNDLVCPFFLLSGEKRRESIPSLPSTYRLSIDLIVKEAELLHALGMPAIALFPVIDPSLKDPCGNYALNEDGFLPQAIAFLKKEIPSLAIITDIALDPYTSHGHDGLIDDEGNVLNDATVDVLAQMALVQAQSGSDIVAPSDMMDGRVKAIRNRLDENDFTQVNILSYTAKYASSIYAPFRDALSSTLTFGDKKSYQMNLANSREALLEARLDEEEGADALMVKPALFCLDIIAKLRASTLLPIAAYHVSGECAMALAAGEKGFLDAETILYEMLLSIKRAGADFIFSYATPKILPLL